MNSDIANTLGMLRQRIRKLQQMEQMLVEEFGDAPTPITSTDARITPTNGYSNGNGDGNQTRKEQLVKYLTDHPGQTRGTINEQSGIPKGTVANLLNKQEFFVRRHGKWYAAGSQSSATQETTH